MTAGTIDETTDRIYLLSTDTTGSTGVQEILTGMWYRTNTV